MTNYTKLEEKVLKFIATGDHFDDMPSATFEQLMESGMPQQQIKGVLSSLWTKDALMYGELPSGVEIYLLPYSTELELSH